jgi:hypothetical protein
MTKRDETKEERDPPLQKADAFTRKHAIIVGLAMLAGVIWLAIAAWLAFANG